MQGGGAATCVLTAPPRDSDACSSSRIADIEQGLAEKWKKPFSGNTEAQKSGHPTNHMEHSHCHKTET